MAQSWSYLEDYIVCKFYLENVETWRNHIDLLMESLAGGGFSERDQGSAKMRVQNYESLHVGKGLSHAGRQSKDIYSAMMRRLNNASAYRILRASLESVDMERLLSSPPDLSSYLRVDKPTGDSFYKVFWKYFRASGLTDPQVYHSCNMGSDTFWRIANGKNEGINKKTVVQLCFGLKLSYDDSLILLEAAGYTLSSGLVFDHVIATYLKNKIYDVNDVNLTLAENEVPSSLYLLQRNRRTKE